MSILDKLKKRADEPYICTEVQAIIELLRMIKDQELEIETLKNDIVYLKNEVEKLKGG